MPLVQKILCPVDFSACSTKALQYAAHFAEELAHASMDLLHTYEYSTQLRPDLTAWINPSDAQAIGDVAKKQAKDALTAFLRQLEPSVRSHIANHFVVFGNATDEIVEFSATHQYDLIVMGTHGHTGLRHLILGSVTDKVVRRSSVPVLTVRESENDVPSEQVSDS